MFTKFFKKIFKFRIHRKGKEGAQQYTSIQRPSTERYKPSVLYVDETSKQQTSGQQQTSEQPTSKQQTPEIDVLAIEADAVICTPDQTSPPKCATSSEIAELEAAPEVDYDVQQKFVGKWIIDSECGRREFYKVVEVSNLAHKIIVRLASLFPPPDQNIQLINGVLLNTVNISFLQYKIKEFFTKHTRIERISGIDAKFTLRWDGPVLRTTIENCEPFNAISENSRWVDTNDKMHVKFVYCSKGKETIFYRIYKRAE